MVAFSTIKAGDVLWDCRRTKMGNTTQTRLSCWQVKVISVDAAARTALASWNSNAPRTYYERQLDKLRRSRPAVPK